MIDLIQIVTLKWNKSNRKYYSEKGYDYTKNGGCANCGSIFISILQRFLQHGGQLCKECSKTESVGGS